MEAISSGPHLPLGFDSGLDDLLYDPYDPALSYGFGEMTAFSFDDEVMLWDADSPNETVSSGAAQSHSHHASAGGSSRSPTGSAQILTPTSTQLDFQDGDGFVDQESAEASPNSSNNNFEDYVYVNSVDGDWSSGYQRTMTRPVRNTRPAQKPLLSSGSPYPLSTHAAPSQQWQMSFSSTSSVGMENSGHPNRHVSSAEMGTYRNTGDELVSNVGGFDTSSTGPCAGTNYQHQGLPVRALNNTAVSGASFGNLEMLSQQMAHITRNTHMITGSTINNAVPQYPNVGSTFVAPAARQHPAGLQAHDTIYDQYLRSMSQNAMLPPSFQMPTAVAAASRPQPNIPTAGVTRPPRMQNQQQTTHTDADVRVALSSGHPPNTSGLHADNLPTEAVNALAKRHAGTANQNESSQRSSYVRDHADRVRKGGRSRNSHLSEKTRVKSSVMRKVGACWRCAMQRDPCDHGDPCSRCTMRSQRGQTYFFDCDRSKLPDFVHDFLPPSMTIMHQKQSIEDAVASNVLAWDRDNGIDIYLSSGYGPPLRWKVFEFKPANDGFLRQLQFHQDIDNGQMVCTENYSPPYGLLKLDTSDDAHLDTYLDQLLEPHLLWDFAWSYYEAESIADENMFQGGVLDLICKLYLKTTDKLLKNLLYDILRMLLIQYIMGHTLTISDETVPTVISNIRHSRTPTNHTQQYTSPRLANRQLKFFFAILRNGIYEKLLKWQQQTLHTAGKKDQTWLPAFCVTLGFAMVLEEVQHSLYVQADAAVTRGEMNREEADRVAGNACERIDARFKLLIGLFQCKYRDRKWGDNGSFGPGTPEVKDLDSQVFLSDMRETMIERYDHLKSRENVTLSRENQCSFTSRLTAKFLLPFLSLPG